jgi:hypothetical protein
MKTLAVGKIEDEDRLVAELHRLGVTYLSNRLTGLSDPPRPPEQILARCVQQPSSRVRIAVIAVFLLHPAYSAFLTASLSMVGEDQRQLLMLFYTSAVYLQRLYQDQLLPIVTDHWEWLPDRFGSGFGIPPGISPHEAIRLLGAKQQQLSHSLANWAGTYESVALHLIRYKQLERQWNQSLPRPSQPS